MFCRSRGGFALGVVLAACLLLAGCTRGGTFAASKGPGGRGDAGVPVSVARATTRDVPIWAEVIGSAEAYSTVTLKSQISGQLMKAHFQEGDFVKSGQLLFTIDPRGLEAQVKQTEANILRDQAALGQAQANLERDKAQQANAQSQLARATQLFKDGVISKEQYDQYLTTGATATAIVRADQAAIENASAQIGASRAALENQKVQLGYTQIFAPTTGRTGALLVKPGNIVTANTTELATINQIQPIFVTFALPESYLPMLRRNAGSKLPVTALPEEGGEPERGALSFVDNAVDTSTGTIRLKATFENPTRRLWPGQFVRVRVQFENLQNAVLVPSQAIQSGQEGTFVYLVTPDEKVNVRPVTAGQRVEQETVVSSGLAAGETVVVEGALRLFPGARVMVRTPNGPSGEGGRGRGKKS
jgi:multidrug efflux system membrane fusion protein